MKRVRTSLSIMAVSALVFVMPVWGANLNPGDSIQDAINGSDAEIYLAPGVYDVANLVINRSVTIKGGAAGGATTVTTDRSQVIIRETGTYTQNDFIYVSANNVSLKNFTVQGIRKPANATRYGITTATVSGCIIENVTVQNFNRTGFNLFTPTNHTLTNVEARDNGGHGLQILDGTGVTVTNITTSGNAWGGVNVTRRDIAQVTGIKILGASNNFGESGFGTHGFMLEADGTAAPLTDTNISFGEYPDTSKDVTIQNFNFQYASDPFYQGSESKRLFFATAADAISAKAAYQLLGITMTYAPLATGTAYNAAFTGAAGLNGNDGISGTNGASVQSASIDQNTGELSLTLTNTAVINAGLAKGSPDTPAQVVAKIATGGNVGIGAAATDSPLTINSNIATILPAGTGAILLQGTSNKERIEVRSFGPGANPAPVIQGKGAQWINDAPTSTLNDTSLFVLGGSGYDNLGNNIIGLKGLIVVKAEGNWSTTSQGALMKFETTPSGSTTRTEKMRITGAGNIGIGVTAPTQKLEVNGGVRINTAAVKPVCDATTRGTIWVTQGFNDIIELCASVNGTLVWKNIALFP